tara:strand:+ start:519 stop:1094 length:576 start_codon:yes stop_codon:yes gene_type:complete
MNLINSIKKIVADYIAEKYKDYLNEHKILFIKEENVKNIMRNLYENNVIELKQLIRQTLRNEYIDEYPTGTVENILLDLFQDKEMGISKITEEIKYLQEINYKVLDIPVINNSLNMNIDIIDNNIIIKNIKNEDASKEIYEIIKMYKFLYSINNTILEEYNNNEKIELIRSIINNKQTVQIGIYYLKKNEN